MADQTSTPAGNLTKGERIPAIERATKRSWAEWVELLEKRGAATLGHAEIARITREFMPDDLKNPDWWAQGTAIAYEQHAGLRVPGQSSTGTFRVGASRTLPLDRDAAIDTWVAGPGRLAEHLGHEVSGARTSRTEKRSFYRFNLAGAGRVEVSATPNAKDPAKVSLAVSHEGLPDAGAIEAWRAHWKAQLAEL